MACKCSYHVKLTILACFGVFLGLIGGTLYAVYPTIFHSMIKKKTVISESNEQLYNAWKSPPAEVLFKLHFFNVTNPDDVANNRSIPILKEIGPYVFKETRDKVKIEFSKDGDDVQYRNKKAYEFDQLKSVGPLTDQITTLNVPFIGIGNMLNNMPGLVKTGANVFINYYTEGLFVSKSVSELGFDGYQVPLIKLIQDHFGVNILPNATFGLFTESKNSDDGLFEINTGKDDSEKFTIIEKWNDKKSLDYWNTKYCNMLNGTDGSQFPPFVDTKDTLYVYSTDLCRSLHFAYEQDIDHHGIKTYRFNAPDNLFADPELYPANECYCLKKPCFGKGLLDVSKCRKGAPVVMSPPHFYQSDEKYLHAVKGLHPSKEKHETFIDVEPNTGAALSAAKRVQVNIHARPVDGVANYENFQEIIFPVAWVEESAAIDEKAADKFKDAVYKPGKIVQGTVIALIAVGCIFVLLAVVFVVISYNKIVGSSWKPKTNASNNGVNK